MNQQWADGYVAQWKSMPPVQRMQFAEALQRRISLHEENAEPARLALLEIRKLITERPNILSHVQKAMALVGTPEERQAMRQAQQVPSQPAEGFAK